jgi:DNA helicase II / ATP-dependent DNA helicase PcrA
MEKLGKKREKLIYKIKKTKKKLNLLQNKLIDLEKNMAQFDEQEILETIPLNEQQKKIVESSEKNILVIACPGSGKTHTLISRYVNIVTVKKNNPDNIILITFTKKAGLEMSNRILNVVPNKLPLYVGTLHGLSYKILNENGYITSTVLDEIDSKNMLLDTIIETFEIQNFDDQEIEFLQKKVPDIIMKASCTYPFNIKKIIYDFNMIKYEDIIQKIYINYQVNKKEQGLLDFNDLMIDFGKFLDTENGKDFIKKTNYVFFDEYQDVNPIQNYILSKFYKNSNIMVVGDDAQAIYSFRGSNIKYIHEFQNKFSPSKIFKLEKNYRSTPSIVNFCQNIIENNVNQFQKKVEAVKEKEGVKPQIISCDEKDQYQWVINDIKKKINEGKKYSDMVVLSRKNKSINDIEFLMMRNKIPCIKQLGLSLLNKNHIKDFIAFVTILINKKSVIHWKRILALHKNIRDANKILNHGSDIFKSIEYFMEKSKLYKKCLDKLHTFIKDVIKKNNPMFQCRYILEYLKNLWSVKKMSNIDAKVEDIRTLLNFLNDLTLEQFISELYLNIEIDAIEEDNLLLSTVHGAKGLEWKYVYIIDMTNNDFPMILTKKFKEQLEQMEEERRLFYVASSRAKKFLTITFIENNDDRRPIKASAFIREIDKKLYSSINFDLVYFQLTGKITNDVNQYLRLMGYSKIFPIINSLKFEKIKLTERLNIPKYLNQYNNKFIISNFFKYLIPKIIKNDFNKKVNKLTLDYISTLPHFSKKVISDYTDHLEDWRDNLKNIFYIASFGNNNKEMVEIYKKYLLDIDTIKFYNNLQEKLFSHIKSLKPKKILLNKSIKYKSIKSNIKFIIDDTILDIKVSENEINTISNICQCMIQGFLLKKNNIKINKICIYNAILGDLVTYDTSDINFSKLQKIIYTN